MTLRGITWDHPRGRTALEVAAERARASGGVDIEWSAHPLEDFESYPIDQLARDYELIVLDHPHLGEALEHGSLRPLDAVVGAARIEKWSHQAVGPSFDSYTVDGYQWAVPLDAATQVSARDARLLDAAPDTWPEVLELARTHPVALSLAGPHAFLTFASLCVALAASTAPDREVTSTSESAFGDGDVTSREPFLTRELGARALEVLRELGARVPEGTAGLNPIGLLERMRDVGDIAYVPLVYGYVTYSSASMRFGEAPSAVAGGRRGSTIGGTGLAVSAHTAITPELVEHVEWLMDPATQRGFIPEHAGQPSNRDAWLDIEVNRTSHDFYRDTLDTIEQSWVRPRFDGYIAFQTAASALLREVILGATDIDDGLDRLYELHQQHGGPALASATAATAPASVATEGTP